MRAVEMEKVDFFFVGESWLVRLAASSFSFYHGKNPR